MGEFDVSVFVVTEDCGMVPAGEYDFSVDGVAAFVGLTNDNLNSEYSDDNTIYIAVNMELTWIPWQVEDEVVPGAFCYNDRKSVYSVEENLRRSRILIRTDLNGYMQTHDIIANVADLVEDYKEIEPGMTVERYVPAVIYVWKSVRTFDGKLYHGYLPSIGQLVYLSENLWTLNDILRIKGIELINGQSKYIFDIDGLPYDDKMDGYERPGLSYGWWSSTQDGSSHFYPAWMLSNGITMNKTTKTEPGYVLPFYKLNMI